MSLNNFLKFNKKIIFKKNQKKYFLITDRGRVVNTLFQSIYGGVINKKYNYGAKVILSSPNNMHQIFKSFGDVQFYKSSIFGSFNKEHIDNNIFDVYIKLWRRRLSIIKHRR